MENARYLQSRVTESEKAIDGRVHSATGGIEQAMSDAGDAAQQAWSQAGDVAEDVVDAGRRATRSVSRQIHESPVVAVLVGIAFACIAGLWLRGGGPNAKAHSPGRPRVATSAKK